MHILWMTIVALSWTHGTDGGRIKKRAATQHNKITNYFSTAPVSIPITIPPPTPVERNELARQLFPDAEEQPEAEDEIKERDTLLLPWKTYERAEYALKHYCDEPVSIEDAYSANAYRCAICLRPMHVVDGPVKRKHFRHNANTNCEGHHPESLDHYYAKQRLAKLLERGFVLKIKRGETIPPSPALRVYDEYLQAEPGDQVLLEYSGHPRWRADIAVLNEDGLKFIIEIVHSHTTEEGSRPEPWYEIAAWEILDLDLEDDQSRIIELRETRNAKSISGAILIGIDLMGR